MKRVQFDAYGPPDVLTLVDAPLPEPAEDEVLVQVAVAGVNLVDLYQRSGAYTVRFPWTPGFEGSGTVVAVGTAVTGVREGDRVAWSGAPDSYAEYCVVSEQRLVPVPDALSLEDAAAALVHGMTAHFLATDVVDLGPDSSCLVHAAAGGVGGLLCQFAAERGATVIGTVSQQHKVEAAREAGASEVIDYSRDGFAAQVRQLTADRGVDVVYDGVGRSTFVEGLGCLRPRGTFVLYGQSSGPAEPLDPQVLQARGSVFLTKASLGHYDTTRADRLRRAAEVFSAVLVGRLRLRHSGYPLADAAHAHQALHSRATIGKILLYPQS